MRQKIQVLIKKIRDANHSKDEQDQRYCALNWSGTMKIVRFLVKVWSVFMSSEWNHTFALIFGWNTDYFMQFLSHFYRMLFPAVNDKNEMLFPARKNAVNPRYNWYQMYSSTHRPTGSRLIPKWPMLSTMSSCLKKKIKRFLSARDLVYHQLLAKYVANKNSGMPKLQAFWSDDDDGDNAKIPKIGRDNASNQGGTTQTAQ